MREIAQKLEGYLLAIGEPVSRQHLMKLLEVTEEQLLEIANEIQEALRDHGLRLMVTDTSLALVTSPLLGDFLSQFDEGKDDHLSKAAAETLALIAYRGPVSRYDIDVLRGVDSRQMVRQLVRRGLARKVLGEGTVPLYEITENFLQHLGLTARQELPRFAELNDSDKVVQLLAG